VRTLLIVFIIALATSARGDVVAEAKEHFRQGESLYQSGHYRDAHAEFLAGFELSHKPAFVFNAAECSRQAGELDTAREEYTRYLELDPAGKHAALARTRLAALGPAPKSPEAAPAAPPAPAAAAAPPEATPTPAPHVDPPVVVAERVNARPSSSVGETSSPADRSSSSLWHRKTLWIGIGAALVAGTVAVFVLNHQDPTCSPPGCVMLK
jgi:hypothetical protein